MYNQEHIKSMNLPVADLAMVTEVKAVAAANLDKETRAVVNADKVKETVTKRKHSDITTITLADGPIIESHPSFNFPPDVWGSMPESDYQHILEQCAAYNASCGCNICQVIVPDQNSNVNTSQITGATRQS